MFAGAKPFCAIGKGATAMGLVAMILWYSLSRMDLIVIGRKSPVSGSMAKKKLAYLPLNPVQRPNPDPLSIATDPSNDLTVRRSWVLGV